MKQITHIGWTNQPLLRRRTIVLPKQDFGGSTCVSMQGVRSPAGRKLSD